jgi:hypothetical protein
MLCLQLLRLFTLAILALSASNGHAIDLGAWARHLQQHEDWTSLDFRNPVSGLFLVARAGTEDKRTGTTLTLTAAPAQGCEAETVIVRKTDAPVSKDTDKLVRVSFQVNGLAPQSLRARLTAQRGDFFIFVQLLEGIPFDVLKNHQMMVVNLPNARRAVFSLAGFESAWSTAQEVCKSFLAR